MKLIIIFIVIGTAMWPKVLSANYWEHNLIGSFDPPESRQSALLWINNEAKLRVVWLGALKNVAVFNSHPHKRGIVRASSSLV